MWYFYRMAISNITLMRAIIREWAGITCTLGEICMAHGIAPGLAVLCINRIGTFGYDVMESNGHYLINPATQTIMVPRLRAIEAMAVHAGILVYTINGHGDYSLFGAVMVLASYPADQTYQLEINPETCTMDINIIGMGFN